MAISGNLSTFLSQLGNPKFHYRPQFHRGEELLPVPQVAKISQWKEHVKLAFQVDIAKRMLSNL